MKKQPELTAQTRQNLTDAFWHLYSAKRIDRITVREITTRAGYNRGTFYEYFADVYDVLSQVESTLLRQLQELPPLSLSAERSPHAFDEFVRVYEKNSKYFVVLLGDTGDPSFQNKIKNSLKPMLKQMLSARGKADDYELDFALEFMLSGMIGVLAYWVSLESLPPAEGLVKLIGDLMENGAMKRFV